MTRSSSVPWGLSVASAMALLLAGCAAPWELDTDAGVPGTPGETGIRAGSPQVFNWTGHVVATELENSTHHFRPFEDVMWPVSQAGILFSVDEIPDAMEVALDWEGSGEFKIMLHSHKAHGTNVYVEHVTKEDYENPKCLRVPSADLTEGTWQVMVHTNKSWQADFTLHIGLLGGAGHVIPDERHGHWRQDGAPKVDEHAIEPCQMLMAPRANATVPTALPSKTHFEFGKTGRCESSTSAGPSCIEFQAGPGGTGAAIDGHWIDLDPTYWNLNLTSAIDQGGLRNDSDCVFTDADGDIIGDPSNGDQPCAGQVPELADWFFIHPYIVPALSIKVDFALPRAA